MQPRGVSPRDAATQRKDSENYRWQPRHLNGELSDPQRSLMAIPRYNEADDVAGPEGRSVTGVEFTIDGGANI